MKWVGLTGGIATGKSTAKKLIEGRGFPVIDADLISHQLTEINAVGYQQIRSHFGNSILQDDQSLNRARLAQTIFSDPQKKIELEDILHPLIKKEVQSLRRSYELQKKPLCFYDVPLLFEKNLKSDFDRVVLVWCDLETQKKRLKLRNQLTDDQVKARLSAQASMGFKIKNADHCLDNSTRVENLDQQIQRLLPQLL